LLAEEGIVLQEFTYLIEERMIFFVIFVRGGEAREGKVGGVRRNSRRIPDISKNPPHIELRQRFFHCNSVYVIISF
jgi:hypothetical protein